jgi:NADH-quinone oxidoreductase subunit L|tara:strand:- start:3690 stop:5789 length:2100 start_codon:yes stop_codon:yes gene_type:complete
VSAEINLLIPWLVFAVPILGALLMPVVARAGNKIRDYYAISLTLVSAILCALMLPLAIAGETFHHQVMWIAALDITAGVLADPLSILMSNIVGWLSFSIMIYSLGYMKGEENMTRYWFLMVFFIGSMQLIIFSDNFLQLFFGWEGVGLCSYGLISFWNKDLKKDYVGTVGKKAWGIPLAFSPTHAGSKAFLMTRVGDVSFLIGILTLFFFSGTFDFVKLSENHSWAVDLAQSGLLIPVAVFIFGGAIGKSAQFPLHEWLPDAMAGPTSVSALIHAATMVKAGVFLIARIGPIFITAVENVATIMPFFEFVAWIGAITAFLAASQAMVAKELKKVLAYSTVSQIGYMMLAFGVAGMTSNFIAGYVAGFFHLASHAVFKAGLFMAAGAIIHATHTKYMTDMGGLRTKMPITFVAMTIAAASLAGIPLLSGFWSKDAILASILGVESSMTLISLYAIASITAVMTAFYSFRMIGMIFFGKPSKYIKKLESSGKHIREAPILMYAPYVVLAIITVAIGLTGPTVEVFLEGSLARHLEHAVNMEIHEHVFSLNRIAVSTSIIAVLIGGGFSYLFYISNRMSPNQVITSIPLLSKLHSFFENRWYINSLYYIVFINGSLRLSKFTDKYIETGILSKLNTAVPDYSITSSQIGGKFDKYVVDGSATRIANLNLFLSRNIRKLQTGIAEQYVFVFTMGIIALIILLG